jgi:hypothetical protein
MPAIGSPTAAITSRIVTSEKAAASTSGTSAQSSGAEARASPFGRIE